jgi:hypothetical protein
MQRASSPRAEFPFQFILLLSLRTSETSIRVSSTSAHGVLPGWSWPPILSSPNPSSTGMRRSRTRARRASPRYARHIARRAPWRRR